VTHLGRRATAEAVGTAFLVAAVIGSGIAATRLSPGQTGLQLLENALITGAALVALILALQPVSAAFNPVVTLVERALGAVTTAEAAALIGAQVLGGIRGAVVANLMFSLPAVTVSATFRSGAGRWLGEVVATTGLLPVIFGTSRTGRSDRVAYAVGGYITAAYWFTSSTSFANPAVTVARMFSDTFAGIAPASAPAFVLMQLIGGAAGYLLIRVLYSNPPAVAADSPAPTTAPLTPRLMLRRRRGGSRGQDPKRAVRLRPQRRTLPDGRRLPDKPRARKGRGPLRRVHPRRPGQPRRGRRDGRRRHQHHHHHTQGLDRRHR